MPDLVWFCATCPIVKNWQYTKKFWFSAHSRAVSKFLLVFKIEKIPKKSQNFWILNISNWKNPPKIWTEKWVGKVAHETKIFVCEICTKYSTPLKSVLAILPITKHLMNRLYFFAFFGSCSEPIHSTAVFSASAYCVRFSSWHSYIVLMFPLFSTQPFFH